MKKYIKFIFLILLFTAMQVFFSTLIPKYTARNINIGIMQEGIEYAIFDKITIDESNKFSENILSNYILEGEMYLLKDNVDKKDLETKILDNMKLEKEELIEIIKNKNRKNNINKSTQFIYNNSKKMFFYAIVSAIFIILSNLTISYTVSLVSKNLREKVFFKIQKFSDYNISNFGISSLITRTTNDITNIQESLNLILKVSLLAPMIFIFSSYQAYDLAPSMTPILIYLVLSIVLTIMTALFLVLPKMNKKQKIVDDLNNIIREILTGRKVIRAFKKQDFETRKYESINKRSKKLEISINLILSTVNPIVEFILNISSIVILYFVVLKLNTVFIGVGTIIAFIQYAINIIVSFIMLSQIFFVVPNIIISYSRVNKILKEKLDLEDDLNAEILDKIREIEFKNVCFKYNGSETNILENINFKIEEGETVGIIGSIGSGDNAIMMIVQ